MLSYSVVSRNCGWAVHRVLWYVGLANQPGCCLVRGPLFIGDGNVNTFCQLHDGTVLVGQSAGIGVAFSDTQGRLLVSNVDVRHIIEGHDHRIWVATDNSGIISFTGDMHQPQSIQSRLYAPVKGNYPLKDATAVYEDSHHRIWAISNGGALFLYDVEKDQFIVVNQRYHLNVNRIYAIGGDEKGQLWLSTDKGLICLKIDDQGKCHPAYYSVEDGLEKIRFSANGLSRFGQELFLGSANGFFSFKPAQMDHWQPADSASLLVTGLQINDRPYEWLDSVLQHRISAEPPYTTRQITIPASIRKFTVEFALLAYQNEQQCKYAYRLEGYDHDWHHVDADNRQAAYQNLLPVLISSNSVPLIAMVTWWSCHMPFKYVCCHPGIVRGGHTLFIYCCWALLPMVSKSGIRTV